MTLPPIQARSMRTLIQRSLCEIGVADAVAAEVEEDLLIRDGRAIARSYRAGGYLAMWMLDLGLVQFYSADGDLVRTYTLLQERETIPLRRAA